jgi:hypothetical protein
MNHIKPEIMAGMMSRAAIHSAECLMANRSTGCPVCEPILRMHTFQRSNTPRLTINMAHLKQMEV